MVCHFYTKHIKTSHSNISSMMTTVLRLVLNTFTPEITQILHSTIPALLPYQVVPYAEYRFFNLTPEELPTNAYATGDTYRSK